MHSFTRNSDVRAPRSHAPYVAFHQTRPSGNDVDVLALQEFDFDEAQEGCRLFNANCV
jgi:hypothetical protein